MNGWYLIETGSVRGGMFPVFPNFWYLAVLHAVLYLLLLLLFKRGPFICATGVRSNQMDCAVSAVILL